MSVSRSRQALICSSLLVRITSLTLSSSGALAGTLVAWAAVVGTGDGDLPAAIGFLSDLLLLLTTSQPLNIASATRTTPAPTMIGIRKERDSLGFSIAEAVPAE